MAVSEDSSGLQDLRPDRTGIRTPRGLRDAPRVHRRETEQLAHPVSRRCEALGNG
jgi:hypothetical protein